MTANKKLVAARKRKLWTQQVLAERMGVTNTTVSNWENGIQYPRPYALQRLCQLFGMSRADLGFALEWEFQDQTQASASTNPSGAEMGQEALVQERMPVAPVTITLALETVHETTTSVVPSSQPAAPASAEDNVLLLSLEELSGEETASESGYGFGKRTTEIIVMAKERHGRATSCHEFERLLNQKMSIFDNPNPAYHDDVNQITRREAIATIVALPATLLTSAKKRGVPLPAEEFLPECTASISSCWHLLMGDGLVIVAEQLPKYLPILDALARRQSDYQHVAAHLATQGNVLMSLVAHHQLQFMKRVAYCQRAVELAHVAGDHVLLVAQALTQLGDAFFWTNEKTKMLQAHQEAESYLDEETPLIAQSKVLAQLAHAYAEQGKTTEALSRIGQSRDLFPNEIGDLPAYLSTDHSLPQVILYEGLTHLSLGKHNPDGKHYQQASNKLAQIETLPKTVIVSERIRLEIINQQALAALKMGNKEDFERYLIAGVQGAKALGSSKRKREAATIYREARQGVWSNEPSVKDLADLFVL